MKYLYKIKINILTIKIMKLVSISKASEILGVSQATLRTWENDKKIEVIHTPNGHRRYDLDYLLENFCKSKK